MLTVQDLLSSAVEKHQSGRIDQAASLYQTILAFAPAQPDALHLLGMTRQRHRRLHDAAALMARSLEINATLASRHADLGCALFDLELFEPAAKALGEAVRRGAAQPYVFQTLGAALRRLGDLHAAAKAFRRAVVLDPALAESWYGIGAIVQGDATVLMAQANGAAAIYFRRVATLRPDHLLAWVNLGIVLFVIGRLEEAEVACRCALAVQPDFDRALLRLGQTRLAQGALVSALSTLRRASALSPADQEIAAVSERASDYRRLSGNAHDMTLPEGLALRGTFRNTSGYAYTVRQFVRQLDAAGVRLQLLDVPVSFLKTMNAGKREAYFEQFDRPVRSRALLNFVIPNLAEPVPGLDSVIFSMTETRAIPPDWLSYSLRQRHLIVPTPSSADAWIRVGFPEDRVHFCPLGVDVRPLSSGVAPMDIKDPLGRRLADYRTRVINISDLTLRKNLDGLLRVWLRATHADDDAALLLKLGKGGPGEEAMIQGLLSAAVAATGKDPSQAAPVFVVSGVYSDDEMTSLMASATHYWSMSHGEGWDQPLSQAGAMGLTLIAPRHSAYTAYLDDDVALMLPARPSPGRAPYCGLEWWSPDEEAAADTIARVVRQGLVLPLSARERLATRFTWEQAGAKLIEVLRSVGALG